MPHIVRMTDFHEHQHEHEHDHGDHDHEHEHEHEHEHHHHEAGDRDKHLVMSFIEALIEERLSLSARRAVFGILRVDPLLRDA
jgi:hypothetical protein